MEISIYTSYFGNSKKLRADGILPICVSLYPPRYLSCPSIKELAPQRFMLSPDYPWDEYERFYKGNILRQLNPSDIIKRIELIAANYQFSKVALCCYEKDDNECHRKFIAEWLRYHGYDVNEYGQKRCDNTRLSVECKQTEMF